VKPLTGMDLVAHAVNAEIARATMSKRAFARKSAIAWNTVDRITAPKAGKEPPSSTMLRQVEGALGMPRDFLTYVMQGDVDAVKASGGKPDLVRWVLSLMTPEVAEPRKSPPKRRATGS